MDTELYLHLYQDSGTDHNLNDTEVITPPTRKYYVKEFVPSEWDGQSLFIEEEVHLITEASTKAGVQSNKAALSQTLRLAAFRQQQDLSMERFWISHRPHEGASIRKAEVYAGIVELVSPIRQTPDNTYLADLLMKVQHGIPQATSATALTLGAINDGPNSPGTLADDASFGDVAWSNPGNAAASDNSYASAVLASAQSTHYLKATNFSFSVPTGATVIGVQVDIEAKATFASVAPYEVVVSLVVGGTVQGDDKGVNALTASDVYYTHGGEFDLWGLTLTPAQVNASNFGVVVAYRSLDPASVTVYVDHIRITVYYADESATILNHDDDTAGHNNYVVVAPASQIDGEVMGLLEINMARAAGNLDEFWMGIALPSSIGKYSFNAEDADDLFTSSLADDANCPGTGGTGGIGQRAETATSLSDATKVLGWNLTAAEVARLQGRHHLFARARASGGVDTMQLKALIGSGGDRVTGEYATITAQSELHLFDLGVIDIPAEGRDPSDIKDDSAHIVLAGYSNGGTTDKIYIADVTLVPVHIASLFVPDDGAYTLIDEATERWHVLSKGHEYPGAYNQRQSGGTWYTDMRMYWRGRLPRLPGGISRRPVFVLLTKATDDDWDIQNSIAVSMNYTNRWRSL